MLLATSAAACGHNADQADKAGTAATSTTASSVAAVPAASKGSAQPLGPCQPTPPAAPHGPSWMPNDLSLPPGSYPVRELSPEGPASRAQFVVPMAPDDFSNFALRTWPSAGWQLGRPESEGFEGENRFVRSPAYGGFKVREVYCDKAVSELTVAYSATS